MHDILIYSTNLDSTVVNILPKKAMAPHSRTLAWKIPWTEEPGGLQSMGSLRVRHDWVTSLSLFPFMHWRKKWQPTPVFLPGESQGRGAWWAAVYGVAQSQTRLKRLSSSSNILSCLLSVDLFSEPFEGSCRHHDTLLWNTIPKNKQYTYHTWGIWILYNTIYYTVHSEIFQLSDTFYIFLFLSRIHSRTILCICLVSVVFFL